MKKIFALLAVVLGMVSCQTEPQGLDVNVGGEQDVTVCVSLPEVTRANDSAEGAFVNVVNSDAYTVRYIFQVFYKGEESKAARQVVYTDDFAANFDVRLVPGREYSFVAWADIVKETERGDWHYNTTNLDAIELKGDWNAMDETRDAFTGVETLTYNGADDINVNLVRPFAKLRVQTTDMLSLANLNIEPTKATVEYTVPHYKAFNALAGTVIGDSKNRNIKHENFNISGYENGTLFVDYFFANNDVVKFNMTVYDQNQQVINKTINFDTDIPAKRNHLTTIKGNILTEANNITVTVENNGAFNDPEYKVEWKEASTAQDLAEIFEEVNNPANTEEETHIVIGGNIDLDDLLIASTFATRAEKQYGLEVPAGKSVVLDLNGYAISQSKECTKSYSMILNNGELTITGNGTIEFTNAAEGGGSKWGTYTIENRSEGVLTIDNVTIRHNGCVNGETEHDTNIAIQNYQGKVVINGGTIASTEFRSLRDFTAGGEIIINGGTFLGQVWMQGEGNGPSSLTINGGNFSPVVGYDSSSVYITNNSNIINVAVNGGMFNTKIGCYDATKEGAKGCIVAGEFTAAAKENTNAALLAEGHVFKALENGNYAVAMTEEAKLRKVLAEGGEVTLEENITIAAQLEVTTTEAIVVNGNNKTITYTGSDRAFNVNGLDTANVTLNNLTFVNTASYCQRGINFNVAGKLTLNNVKVSETGTPATYAINLPGSSDGAEVVINNSYFRGNIALNVWGENAKINATGSEFVSYDGNKDENYTAISLNSDGSSNIANGTTIYIDGGSVIARDEKGEPSYAVRNSTKTGVVTISDSTEVVGTIKEPVVTVIYEGYNEFYSFTTLKDAIDKAIETKGSVRLIKDITVDETITIPAEGNVTIDLNGHNITSNIAGKPSAGFELFSVNGKLEIKGNGTISLTSEDFEWNTSYRYTAINIRETGVVTLGEGVNVICEASKDGKYGMSYAVDIYTTGTLNINGASLHSNYIAVRCFYGASVVNVNSGSKITSSKNNYGIWLQSATGAVVTIADDVNYTFENNIYYFN